MLFILCTLILLTTGFTLLGQPSNLMFILGIIVIILWLVTCVLFLTNTNPIQLFKKQKNQKTN